MFSVSAPAHLRAILVLIIHLRRAQILPEISADPSVTVINFCRTPQWYVPRVSRFLSTSDTLIHIDVV